MISSLSGRIDCDIIKLKLKKSGEMAETNIDLKKAVFGGDNSSNLGELKQKYKYIRLALGLLLIIGFGVLLAILQPKFSSTAFSIGDMKYSKKDLKALISAAAKHEVNKNQATDAAILTLKQTYAAKTLGVQTNEADISIVASTLYQKKPSNLDAWEKLQAEQVSLQNELSYAQDGRYEGYVYYFPFDRLMANNLPDVRIKDYGNSDAIAKNRQYAKDQAELALHQRFTKKITAEALLEKIRNDQQLESVGTLNPSIDFVVNGRGSIPLAGAASFEMEKYLVPFIVSSTKPRMSPVQITQKDFPPYMAATPAYIGKVDTMYYFIEVDKVTAPNKEVLKQFNDIVSKSKVHRNV